MFSRGIKLLRSISSKHLIDCLEFCNWISSCVKLKNKVGMLMKFANMHNTKIFHLELVDTLCSISKVSISLLWVKVMLNSAAWKESKCSNEGLFLREKKCKKSIQNMAWFSKGKKITAIIWSSYNITEYSSAFCKVNCCFKWLFLKSGKGVSSKLITCWLE